MPEKQTKTRWTRAFKLQAVARMEGDATDIKALAAELGVQRILLHRWREKYRAGGEEALHQFGRVPRRPRGPKRGTGQRRRRRRLAAVRWSSSWVWMFFRKA